MKTRKIIAVMVILTALTGITKAWEKDDIIVGTADGYLLVLDNNDLALKSLGSSQGNITAVAALPNGNIIEGTADLTTPSNSKIRLKNANNVDLTLSWRNSSVGAVIDIEVMSDNSIVVAGTSDKIYKLRGDDDSLDIISDIKGDIFDINDIEVQEDNDVLIIQNIDGGRVRIREPNNLDGTYTANGWGQYPVGIIELPNGNVVTAHNDGSGQPGIMRVRQQDLTHVASKVGLNADLDWVDMDDMPTNHWVVVADKKIQIYEFEPGNGIVRRSNWVNWPGSGNVTSVVVQSDDDIVIGTDTGSVYIYRWNGFPGDLVEHQASINLYEDLGIGGTYPVITDLAVQPALTCEEARRQDHGLSADLVPDCVIDFKDMAELASQWLQSYDPSAP